MQVLKVLLLALYSNPGVRAALGSLASAVLLGAVAWVQTPEAAALLGAGWLIQVVSPSIMELLKPKPADPAQLTQKQPEVK